ncbi:hypothetical protein [Maribacter sp. 2-571]|uniref:hypothetical protein n=1 Tax=Maribacter sp. 2-571 TaxID=3417569 RepID=UPI003D3280A5
MDADILVLQEVENQKNLELFNQWFLKGAYDTVLTVPTTDSRSRHMAVLLKDGLVLEEVKAFGGTPPKDETHFSHAAQLYRILDTKGGKYDLVNLHFFDAGTWDYNDPIYDDFLSELAQKLKMELYGTGARMIMGTLNILPYHEVLERILEPLGMFKINDSPSFRSSDNVPKNNSYNRLGAYKEGINILQKQYLLVSKYLTSHIWGSGLLVSHKQDDNRHGPVNWIGVDL